MSVGIQYPTNDRAGIISEFYNRLLEYDTTIADSNLFYVSYSIPDALTDDLYRAIGETAKDGRIGISPTKEVFQTNKIQALTTGVDLPDDKVDTQVIPHGSQVNGYLPITVNANRSIDTTGLKTVFYDTNLSLNDFIFKPWIRLISRYGSFTNALYTNVTVVFLGKRVNKESNNTIVRKMYNFYDCIPVDTESKDSYEYASDPTVNTHRIQWKFNRYDIELTRI